MTKDELAQVLELHRLYSQGDPGGRRADLKGADLKGADLKRADL